MSKIDIGFGLIIGILSSLLGIFLFIVFFTEFDFWLGINTAKDSGYLGKIITLGSILNIPVFLILLKNSKEDMARGIVVAVILLALSTLVV